MTTIFLSEPPVKLFLFLAALIPALAAVVVAAALRQDFAWYHAAGLFYAALTLAELGYLGGIFLRNGAGGRMLQDRSAKTGAAE